MESVSPSGRICDRLEGGSKNVYFQRSTFVLENRERCPPGKRHKNMFLDQTNKGSKCEQRAQVRESHPQLAQTAPGAEEVPPLVRKQCDRKTRMTNRSCSNAGCRTPFLTARWCHWVLQRPTSRPTK